MTGGEAVVRRSPRTASTSLFGIPGTHTLELHRHLAAYGIRHVTPRHEAGGGVRGGRLRARHRPPRRRARDQRPGRDQHRHRGGDRLRRLRADADRLALDADRRRGPRHRLPARGQGPARRDGRARRLEPHARRTPEDAAQAIHDAFASFASGRPRPVHVQIPIDVLTGDRRNAQGAWRRSSARRGALGRALTAARLLAGAQRPVVVAGGGARGADLAALGVPVITTVNGKGVLDERHPLSLGASIRLRAAQRFLAEARRGARDRDGARRVGPVGAAARARRQADPRRHRSRRSATRTCARTWP